MGCHADSRSVTFGHVRCANMRLIVRICISQAGLENTIVFKVRNCKRMKEVRKKMKEFYAEYDGTRFDIYDASPMFTDNGWVLVKCRAVA